MRIGCWGCTLKHLSQAAVLAEEVHCGYHYVHRVLGHLQEAAEECYRFNRRFSLVLRAHRIHYEDTLTDAEPGGYSIPFEEFECYIRDCMAADDQGLEEPDVPEGCCEGLEMKPDGTYDLLYGDMRPLELPAPVRKNIVDEMGMPVVDSASTTDGSAGNPPQNPRTPQ